MPCVHGNIEEILAPKSFDRSDSFKKKATDIDQAFMCSHQYCFTHDMLCPILGPKAKSSDYDISGLPCPDMSKAGKRKREEGVTSGVFACHAKYHVERQTPMLVIENVQEKMF